MSPAGNRRNQGPPGVFDPSAEADLREIDPDVRLMLAFRGGDLSAFEGLFQRWASRLLRYLARMVRDRAVAEELVQEVFLRVHRARDGYKPEARFSTWIYRIATNLALNELRRPRHRDPHYSMDEYDGFPLVAEGSPVDDVVHARLRSRAAVRELEGLPDRQRAALWLVAVEGLAYADVARALDVSEKAVKALVHRARTNVAAKLGEGE
ncbi:MAG: RNA polymerase sigma factor [Myxococcota bacterium]